jgi:hypothetical protein
MLCTFKKEKNRFKRNDSVFYFSKNFYFRNVDFQNLLLNRARFFFLNYSQVIFCQI